MGENYRTDNLLGSVPYSTSINYKKGKENMYAKFCGLLALIFFSNSVLASDNYWRYENYDDGWVVMGLIGLAIIVFQSLREGFKKSAFNGLGRLTMFCFAGYIAISIPTIGLILVGAIFLILVIGIVRESIR